MAESITLPSSADKQAKYESLLPQIKALIEGEENLIANLANTMAALREGFGFLWVGCYLVEGDELVLGPFQGPVACTRIAKGRGVCGTAWREARTVIVEDVDAFPGHIACSSLSRSEIVLPVTDRNGVVCMVLDIDSDRKAAFDETDARYLRELTTFLGNLF